LVGRRGSGSLLKNGAPEMVHTLFVVVPDKDAAFFEAGSDAMRRYARNAGRFRIRVVPESMLFTVSRKRLQQLR
jgi:hypothetical protein